MEHSAAEYSQSGLPSPHPSNCGDPRSEGSSADQPSAAQYSSQQEVRPSNYSASATPTSEYGVYPSSARSGSFPEHIHQRPYHPASNPSGSSGGMAQQTNNPSIAGPSPTYAYGQPSPYGPPPGDIAHGYQHAYPQPRPDWGGYGQHSAGLAPAGHVFPTTPSSAPPGRPHQVYSFVPIPGAQQHKRPRRRYEEIERMYKCGWNGCEKAYGTLNHLNAHVTMQSHGAKRTPEEFKEIRKEWKQRKKEEEAARKAEEEQRRAAVAAAAQAQAQNAQTDPQSGPEGAQPGSAYTGNRQVQLPPIGYQPSYPGGPPSGVPQQPLPEYNSTHMYSANYQPQSQSPYAQPGQGLYSQRR
ncbi:hypothetical protein SODALDRAFT_326237 [Sodiomyces alkalinus F11]|uniref:C2H2-type domain-containing protein n=1 Tax=Sodiomyces alkalinus (strain CBS 110278 / VKM F-3762 / F11) TaxID=1314773 RepID=A0A3N2Q5M3_SODAK|nr:hypothetical protein SODALDRAFT_326237 [Sodiomyces alkalinus F11]ROT42074.1 hypothetical protein SODALDRAFT_326237 [Sodiomyces alkalinus F11]